MPFIVKINLTKVVREVQKVNLKHPTLRTYGIFTNIARVYQWKYFNKKNVMTTQPILIN